MKKIITIIFLHFSLFNFAQSPKITSVVPAQYCKGDKVTINYVNFFVGATPTVTIGGIPQPITGSSGWSNNINLVDGTITVQIQDGSVGNIGVFEYNTLVSYPGGYKGASKPGTIAGETLVCRGQNTVVYSVLAIADATSYQWTLPSGASGTSTTNSISVNYGLDAVPGNISVKGINSCGSGLASILAITLDKPFNAGAITGEKLVCAGQNAVVYSVPAIANATSYQWILPSGATGSSTTNSITVNYGLAAVSGNISVNGVNPCGGNGQASTFVVTVNNSIPLSPGAISGPKGVISVPQEICRYDSNGPASSILTYSVLPIANATSYQWTLPSGLIGTSTTNSITVDYSSLLSQCGGICLFNGSISVSGVNGCGVGPKSTISISIMGQITPMRTGVISGITTVCQGQNAVVYSVPPAANATSYQWTLPSGATGLSTTNSITVNYGLLAVSGNITVLSFNFCGSANISSTLPITVSPLPSGAGIISGMTGVCQGQNAVVYSIPAIANATSYQWSLPSGATGTSTTNSITVNYGSLAASGNITVNGVNSCGTGLASTRVITVYTLPSSPGTISGTASVCPGQNNVVYSVPVIANATSYQWTLPSGATGTSTTNSISVNYGLSAVSGDISVKGINSCGIGVAATLTISVNNTNTIPSSAQTISGITSVCLGQNNVLYTVPVIANATSYQWGFSTGATGTSTTNSISVNYGLSAVSGYIIVRGVNCYGIGSTTGGLYVNVNTPPSNAGLITGSATVCAGQNAVVYSVPAIANATSYQWTLPSGATGTSTTNSIGVDYGLAAVSGNISVKGVNSCGAGVASVFAVNVINCSLPSNNFKLEVTDPTCQTKANGKLKITATASFNYTAIMDGVNYTFTNNILDIANLAPKTYTICIKVPALNNYIQCFEFTVKSAPGLTAKTRMDTKGNKTTANVSIESGTAPYTVEINGKTIDVTFENQLNISVQNGDLLEIKTSVACEGKIRERVSLSNELMAYPNPTSNFVELFIPNTFQKKYVMIQMVDNGGKSVVNRELKIIDNSIIIPMENLSEGLYIINVQLETLQTIKIIKK